MLTYAVQLDPQEEGGYTVTVPALPGCISEGDTLEEALGNIKDAIDGYLRVLAKNKRTIPIELSKLKQVSVFKKQTSRVSSRRKVYA